MIGEARAVGARPDGVTTGGVDYLQDKVDAADHWLTQHGLSADSLYRMLTLPLLDEPPAGALGVVLLLGRDSPQVREASQTWLVEHIFPPAELWLGPLLLILEQLARGE